MLSLAGIGTAHADPTFVILPSASGLTDGQQVTIQVNGLNAVALAQIQLSECGNAYGDGTPLSSIVQGSIDCTTIPSAFGPVNSSTVEFDNVPMQQTGVGAGNRSCIDSPPAVAPCYLYVSSSINQPVLPSPISIFFAADPPVMTPAATTSTLMPIGAPLGSDKTAHALVQVSTTNPQLQPEGNVTVYEDSTLLGSGTLANGEANVALGMLSMGTHNLVAHYVGDGSFLSSDAPSTPMTVIGPNNISIGDVSIVEGNSGFRTVAFPVVLSRASSVPFTVQYVVAPSGTNPATAGATPTTPGADFVSTGALMTLKFAAGKQTVKYIVVKVLSDTTPGEGDQTFSVTLSNPQNGYVLRRAVGQATIIDDDSLAPGVRVNIGDASVPEGDVGGSHAMKLPLTLSQPVLTGNVITTVRISSVTAIHGNKLTGDWGGQIVRNLTFKNGAVNLTVAIPAFPDTNDELNETLRVDILGVAVTGTTVTIGRGSATGTILTDE